MQINSFTIGIDEAGRGSWAWPVVAAACIFLADCRRRKFYRELADSKALSPEKREELFSCLKVAHEKGELVYWVGIIAHDIIDSVGIREANRRAMEQAMRIILVSIPIDRIGQIRIDGRDNYSFEWIPGSKLQYIVGGDGLVKEIQAASIIAKVMRDRLMVEYGNRFPDYGFERHKWYGTEYHQMSLEKYGPIEIHRRSYEPVKKLILSDV